MEDGKGFRKRNLPVSAENVPGPSKQFRHNHGDESGYESSFDVPTQSNAEQFTENTTGVIEKIYMKNFMCHSSFEIVLNPRCNFISGKNGSGKSAILTAAVVGLGGKATATNRGSNLKDFIMKGKNSASVEITIRNVGEFAYKPEEYGERIIVTRILSNGTQSGYKIKSENGRIVSTKREVLDGIVSALNLQVENPICILNQDAARSFLNTSDPRQKYNFFVKATHLEKLFSILQDVGAEKQRVAGIVKSRKEALGVSENELRDLQRKKEQLESVQNYRDKVASLRSELQWAMVLAEEQAVKELENELHVERNRYMKAQKVMDNETEEEQKLRDTARELEQQLHDVTVKLSNCESEIAEWRREQKQRKEKYFTKLNEHKILENKITQKNEIIQSLNTQIEKLQRMCGPENAAKQAKIKEDIQNTERKLSDLHHVMKNHKEFLRKLNADRDTLITEERRLQGELNEAQREIEKKEQQIQDYKREKSNSLMLFGSWASEVARRIEEAWKQGRFGKKPRGPLGAYMKVRDAAWIPTIESFIGAYLKVYCVDSSNDYRELHKIFTEVLGNGTPFPIIITSKFYEKVHDVSRNEVKIDAYTTLKNALIISDPVLENCLIDNREIETIILIPTDAEARFLMSDPKMVPKNCKRALTMEGSTYFPVPNYRTYAGENRPPRFLQVSIADVISSIEKELVSGKNHLKTLQEGFRTLQGKLRGNAEESSATSNGLRDMNTNYLSIERKLSSLRNTEEYDSNSIGLMLEELQETVEKLKQMKAEKLVMDEECNRLKAEQEEAHNKVCTMKDAYIKIAQNEQEPIEVKIKRLRDDLERILSKKRGQKDKIQELLVQIEQMGTKLKKQQEAAMKASEEAARLCPRIDTERSPKIIERELFKCNTYMKRVESITGTFDEVNRSYNEKKQKFDRIMEDIAVIENCIQQLSTSIEIRLGRFMVITRLLRLRTKIIFREMLKTRNFEGDINIDQQKKTIEIEVSPSATVGSKRPLKDTKSLSGGERSFSTVCFIMALWDCIEPPFFFLDEFDVFMDKVNRRMVVDTLMAHVTQKTARQFVFLTPLDLNGIEIGQNVAVHRLSDPRSVANTQ